MVTETPLPVPQPKEHFERIDRFFNKRRQGIRYLERVEIEIDMNLQGQGYKLKNDIGRQVLAGVAVAVLCAVVALGWNVSVHQAVMDVNLQAMKSDMSTMRQEVKDQAREMRDTVREALKPFEDRVERVERKQDAQQTKRVVVRVARE